MGGFRVDSSQRPRTSDSDGVIASVYSLLARHASPAADELLLEAARVGSDAERAAAVESLLHRGTPRGLAGLVELFDKLPDASRRRLGDCADALANAVARCARSDETLTRVAAARFVAAVRSPKLGYLLADLLRSPSPLVFDAAGDAAQALAEWVDQTTTDLRERRLADAAGDAAYEAAVLLRRVLEEAVLSALETTRGADSPALAATAAILLERRPGVLAEGLKRHGGRGAGGWPLVLSRLTTPASDAAAASLLACAARGTLKSDLSDAVAGIERPGVLDGLLRNTHLLADPATAAAVSVVGRGVWWSPASLRTDLAARRPVPAAGPDDGSADRDDLQAAMLEVDVVQARPRRAGDAAGIGQWVAAGGATASLCEELFEALCEDAADDDAARTSLLRSAGRAGDGSLPRWLAGRAADGDERVARMAVRALARAPSTHAEAALLRRAADAPAGVRETIGRCVGRRSFDALWDRYDRLSLPERSAAGRTLLRLLPQAAARLRLNLLRGPLDSRLRALRMTGEVGAAVTLREGIYACCCSPEARLRSKAVLCLGEIVSAVNDEAAQSRLDAALADGDARVRANAVEVLEKTGRRDVLPLLRARARLGRNRERANAIRATQALGLGEAGAVDDALFEMLRDAREPHRLSAVWAVEQTGRWGLLDEVVRLARTDPDLAVRRGAVASVRRVAERMRKPLIAA